MASRRTVVLALAALVIFAMGLASSVAAQDSKEAWKESGMELKVYDIKAFLERTPIYNFARVPGTDQQAMSPKFNLSGTLGTTGAGMFDVADADPDYLQESRARQRELSDLIQQLVSPKEPWDVHGGRGSIVFLSSRGQMFVKTTPDGHQQIVEILKHVLPGSKSSVVVDIKVVELEGEGLGDGPAAGFVARTDAERAALNNAIRKVHQHVVLTGTDGQVLSNERGLTHSYVSQLEPVISDLAAGLNATVDVLTDGLAVEVQPTMSTDGKTATLDFRLIMSRTVALREGVNGVTTVLQKQEAAFDLPTIASDAQAGTINLPIDSPMIIAGGTVPAKLVDKNAADDAADISVFYVATVRVIKAAAEKE